MRLWKRATGALKDRNSIWIASLSRRSAYRNPELEAVIIKATSHDESYLDYKNSQRVFQWVRTSPIYLKPLLWMLSMRMRKTRSWVVALKGLMLMHGVFHCKIPAVQMIGRLPFDLSNFTDAHSKRGKTWGYNSFIRIYFVFLDQKSGFLSAEMKVQRGRVREMEEEPLMEELIRLQKFQSLLDMLLQIKPHADNMVVTLILEAMECVIVEIFEVYSRFCSGIAQALLRIYENGGEVEAAMALKVLHKARVQSEELCRHFEFCRDIGVLNASEIPRFELVQEEDIIDLEGIINGISNRKKSLNGKEMAEEEGNKAIVVKENGGIVNVEQERESKRVLRTIITEEWEVFDEDLNSNWEGNDSSDDRSISTTTSSTALVPFVVLPASSNQVIPDLISF
ncbi:putative clathrin assembly protein At1g25240 [Fagus crenata]